MAGNASKYSCTPDEAVELLYQKGLIDDSNPSFLQTLIDDRLEVASNAFFWQEHFTVDGNETPADLSKRKVEPAYSVIQKTKTVLPMADPMAPLADVSQLDSDDYTVKTGSIHQYGRGLYQNSMGKLELQARLAELGNTERDIIGGFVKQAADLITTHNYRLSYMAAQTLSMGGAYNTTTTRGASGVNANQDAYIPLDNYKKAGTRVWTDPECDIPSQIQGIVEKIKIDNSLGDDYPFELDVPYDMMASTLLNNKYFVSEVNRYIRLYAPDKVIVIDNGVGSVNTSIISMEQLVAYSRSSLSKIPPIRIVKQSSVTQNITTSTTVTGWADGKVVLRPLGYAGVVVHATPNDIAMYNSGEVNSSIQMSIAKSQGFLYIINKVTNDGMFKAYHTDIIGRYATILSESMYHYVIDTKAANA